MTYDGEIISGGVLYLKVDKKLEYIPKKEPFAKIPRGLVFKASKKFWALVNNRIHKCENSIDSYPSPYPDSTITISSYSYRRREPELWFTK